MFFALRPILHRLDPESAHTLVLAILRLVGAVPPLRAAVSLAFGPPAGKPVRLFGVDFPNRVGLAAGYDKDALAWRGLACLGFGHVEIGTVTPRPQRGNPRPRVFRLPAERSLINRLGFPGRGADFVAQRLSGGSAGRPVLGVNLGKQKETPLDRAADDYIALMSRFAPLADYLTINVSSPNTPGLRALQEGGRLEALLGRLAHARSAIQDQSGRAVPLLIKLSPDLGDDELDRAVVAIRRARLDGVIATNTTTTRPGLGAADPVAAEAGGLSGAALRERSTEVLRRIAERAEGQFPIVACGGIASAADAREKIDAGASLVQLYTGLVYEGPGLVRQIAQELGPTPTRPDPGPNPG